jgi:hypothetical protein
VIKNEAGVGGAATASSASTSAAAPEAEFVRSLFLEQQSAEDREVRPITAHVTQASATVRQTITINNITN